MYETDSSKYYININESIYFSKLHIKPKNKNHMIILSDLHGFIKYLKMDMLINILNNYEMSSLQLDTFFIVMRKIYAFELDIIKKTCGIFIKELNISMPEEIKVLEILINNLFEDIIVDMDENKFLRTMIFLMNELLQVYKNYEITRESVLNLVRFIRKNINKYTKSINIAYQFIFGNIKNLSMISEYLLICQKSLTEEEIEKLKFFIENNKNLEIDYENDIIIKKYYDRMNNTNAIICYNNISRFNKKEINPIKKMIDPFILKYNFEVADIKFAVNKNHKLEHCLIEHKFVDNIDELINILYKTLISESNTTGFIINDDSTTLYEYYQSIVIQNNINICYHDYIYRLTMYKSIPYEVPLEIILRILSRLFDIIIGLYEINNEPIIINNTIIKNPITINIIKYNNEYYNIININETFIPLGKKLKKCEILTLNDINDIVEI